MLGHWPRSQVHLLLKEHGWGTNTYRLLHLSVNSKTMQHIILGS